jgi:hypothetical protein
MPKLCFPISLSDKNKIYFFLSFYKIHSMWFGFLVIKNRDYYKIDKGNVIYSRAIFNIDNLVSDYVNDRNYVV